MVKNLRLFIRPFSELIDLSLNMVATVLLDQSKASPVGLRREASQALVHVCRDARDALKGKVGQLMTLVVASAATISDAQHLDVIKAVVEVIMVLDKSDEFKAALVQLVQLLVQGMEQELSKGEQADSQRICGLLDRLAVPFEVGVRRAAQVQTDGATLAQVLSDGVFPQVRNALQRFASEELVPERAGRLMKLAQRCVKLGARPVLQGWCELIVTCFEQTHRDVYCYAAEVLADTYGAASREDEALEAILRQMLDRIAGRALQFVRSTPGGFTETQNFVEDFCGMWGRYMKNAPRLAVTVQSFEQSVELAIEATVHMERPDGFESVAEFVVQTIKQSLTLFRQEQRKPAQLVQLVDRLLPHALAAFFKTLAEKPTDKVGVAVSDLIDEILFGFQSELEPGTLHLKLEQLIGQHALPQLDRQIVSSENERKRIAFNLCGDSARVREDECLRLVRRSHMIQVRKRGGLKVGEV